jgi:hypothetical protein
MGGIRANRIAIVLLGIAMSSTLGREGAAFAQSEDTELPVDQIEQIVGAQGHVSHGVLDISIAREDIGDVQGPRGITLTPAFENHGDLYFQPLGKGKALLNGDMALREEEVNPFISALLDNDLVFQAFHQHMPTQPQIWFVHFRGVRDPIALAHAIRAAISVTSTPLPQTSPENPTSPLDADQLASILHGEAEIGDEGVVSVTIDRAHPVRLGGVTAEPETGISTTVEFRPTGGDTADVVADFSMTSGEVDPVVRLMLTGEQWYQGCLYNQETAERPQLYFDHMVQHGNAYDLARQIRRGLDLTRSK